MPPFFTAQVAVGGILCAIATLHLVLSTRHIQRQLHLTFSLIALSVAVEAFLTPWRYRAESGEDLLLAVKWSSPFHVLFGVSLVWFTRAYAGWKKSSIPIAITVLGAIVVALHILLPYGIIFNAVPSLRPARLPWGELIIAPVAPRNPMLVLGNIFSTGLIVFLITSCVRLWREGETRKAKALAIGLAPTVFVAWPHGLLTDWGLASPPYLYNFAFFGLVLIMSLDLVNDAVRAVELSRKVESSDLRWRTLLENVRLLVVGLNRDGALNYVNPFFSSISGYSREELLDRKFEVVLPQEEIASFNELFNRAISGQVPEHAKSQLLRKDGGRRTIFWSNVLIYDEQGAIAGTLSIGADITKQAEAEGARDEAIRKLEDLRLRLEAENLYLKEEIFADIDSHNIIGQSAAIRYVVHKIHQVAATAATVLIEGETGVGKELVARAVHQASPRATGPFIRVNCAALSPTLIESELFGHEKGAFTGADRVRKGRFELADGGTLFLDEVGELPSDVQAKLLRVLQEGEFERVGDSHTRRVDVRMIAATNRDLRREVDANRFREDLFYRLQIYPITVPPLRERREDIPPLVRYFATKLARRHGKSIDEVPGHVMKEMAAWDWPGNVRELENVIERAVISSPGPMLAVSREFAQSRSDRMTDSSNSLVSLEHMERTYILRVMEHTNWQIAGSGGAAEILCLHPNTLRSRMAKLGISRESRMARQRGVGA